MSFLLVAIGLGIRPGCKFRGRVVAPDPAPAIRAGLLPRRPRAQRVIFLTNTTTNSASVKLPVKASKAAKIRDKPMGVKSP